LYILWVLRTNGPTRFGVLKRKVEGISTRLLTERLRMLEAAGLVYRQCKPTAPPHVTYGLTERMEDLTEVLDQLNTIAQRWYAQDGDRSDSAVEVLSKP
jgi:DNA-binding HxlR family transcriptional regulator